MTLLLIKKENEVYMANFNKRFFGMVVLSLILFTGIFLIKEKCYAYSENFDSYANGLNINTITNWSGDNASTTNNSFYSSPNSLSIGYGSESLLLNDYNYLSFAFKKNTNWTIGQMFIGGLTIKNATNTDYLLINANTSGDYNIYFQNSGGIKENIYQNYDLDNNWHIIYLTIDSINNNLKYKLDNNSWNTSLNIHFLNNTWSQHFIMQIFVDNKFILIDNISTKNDVINLTHPEDYSMQDKNLLYWAYNFTISSSSYAAYDRFYTYLYYIPPVLDATTTRIEEAWLKPATQPETTYVVIYNNGIYIPLYLGEYAAGVYLTGEKGYDTDILAESDITFTMISSTSTPPTAWCSGLCNDLSTSTSAWWKFWDDTIDKTTTGLTCAGRYFVCYSFYPHTYTQELFGEVYNKFKLVFPFNIFFEITSTIDNVFASTTMASTTGSFGLPMIRKVGTTSQYYILPLLTSSTTSNFLGNSNANLLRFSLSSIIYAFYIVGIILILW